MPKGTNLGKTKKEDTQVTPDTSDVSEEDIKAYAAFRRRAEEKKSPSNS